MYFKAGEAVWRQVGGDAAVQLFKNRWVKVPSDNEDFGSFAELTDMEKFFDGALGDHGVLAKGETAEVDGTSAIKLEDTTEDGTLYIATEGEAYPLKLEGGKNAPGAVVFDEWNGQYVLEAPKSSIDISQLPS
jgi:hypothetical protein